MSLDLSLLADHAPLLAQGVLTTLKICLISFLFIPVTGFALAWIGGRSWRPARLFAIGYVEAIRNTPFLIQAFLLFYALPQYGVRMSAMTTGIICMVLYGTAYFAEAARAAYASVPRGQFDAADALGLRTVPRFRFVVLPQMWLFLIPQVGNIAIFLVKESAVLSVITVPEITFAAQLAVSRTFSPFEFYFAIALLYWAISALLTFALGRAEDMARSHLRPR